MSTGTTIFLIALVLILAFGATMIWQTFRNTERRRGSHNDEEAIERQVRGSRGFEPGPDTAGPDDRRRRFDVGDDVKPGQRQPRRHGRHEFR